VVVLHTVRRLEEGRPTVRRRALREEASRTAQRLVRRMLGRRRARHTVVQRLVLRTVVRQRVPRTVVLRPVAHMVVPQRAAHIPAVVLVGAEVRHLLGLSPVIPRLRVGMRYVRRTVV
jgi:hypothetical protein